MTSSKRPKYSLKWPLLAPTFSLLQHLLLGFRFQNNKSWMDRKPVDQGAPRRKFLRNLAFGSPRVPTQSYGKGSKIWFSPLCRKQSVFFVLTKSKKQIRIQNLHQILDPGKLHQVFVMASSLYIVCVAKNAMW